MPYQSSGNKVSSETSFRSSRWVPKSSGRLHIRKSGCPAESGTLTVRALCYIRHVLYKNSRIGRAWKMVLKGRADRAHVKKDLLYRSSGQVERAKWSGRDPPAMSRLRIDFAGLG